jgi:signal transduction histidine kinase
MLMWGFPVMGCALLASALLVRRWPLIALAVTLGAAVIIGLKPWAIAQLVVLAVAAGLEICYTAATRSGRVSAAGAAMAAAASLLIPIIGPPSEGSLRFGSAEPGVPTVTIVVLLVTVIAWLIGHSIRQAQDRAELLRTQAATQAAMAERLRIARELHDVVAHSIGVIAIQAGSGRSVFDARPDQARDALAAIEGASRETLSGLRRMVSGLRQAEPVPGPWQAPLGPAPGLADVGQLAATALDAGVQVDVEWRGSREPLPADIDLSAFRIIQEAVTNVIRHAGTGQCHVLIDRQDGQLSIEITDSGRGGTAAGTGYGITGMSERAALLGGDLSAGPRPGGGYCVAARLPVPAPAPAPAPAR